MVATVFKEMALEKSACSMVDSTLSTVAKMTIPTISLAVPFGNLHVDMPVSHRFKILYLSLLGCSTTATLAFADFDKEVLPFLENYCLDCHDDGPDSKGGLDLGIAVDAPASSGAIWYRVMKAVHFH